LRKTTTPAFAGAGCANKVSQRKQKGMGRKYMNQLFDKKELWGKRKRKNQQNKVLGEMVKLGYEK